MKNDNAPILITGLVRSGTSWTGEMLSFADGVCQLFEPFHPDHPKVFGNKKVRYHFVYSNDKDLEMESYVKGLLNKKYFIVNELLSMRNLKDLLRVIFRYIPSKIMCTFSRNKVLIKDPYAFFLAEWLTEKYQFKNVVLIRHPVAFVESFARNKSWDRHTICNSLLKQKGLLIKYDLLEYEDDLRKFSEMEKEIKKTKSEGFVDERLRLERASLIWNIFAKTYIYYKAKYNWVFLKYEDVAINPVSAFKGVYESLGLTFRKKHEEKIKTFCSEGNKASSDKFVDLKRDSKSLVISWKKNMAKDDIKFIKELTNIYGMLIYEHEF